MGKRFLTGERSLGGSLRVVHIVQHMCVIANGMLSISRGEVKRVSSRFALLTGPDDTDMIRVDYVTHPMHNMQQNHQPMKRPLVLIAGGAALVLATIAASQKP